MSGKKQRLELTWIGKDERPKLEPRILLEDPERAYARRRGSNDLFDNRIIYGDNLLALKALEQTFEGQVKCIYIDPPYNTGQAFAAYDDGVEHSIWLTLMRDRFTALRLLLRQDGLLFCQLNDDEMAYGKVLLDEVFGRANFLNQISVRMKLNAGASGGGEDKKLKKSVEYILVYAKDRDGAGGFSKFNDVYDEEDLLQLIEEMEGAGQSWKYTSVLTDKGALVDERVVLDGSGQEIRVKKYKGVRRTTINSIIRGGKSKSDAYVENFSNIFSDTNAQTSIRTRIMEEFVTLEEDELLESQYVPRSGRERGQVATHYYISNTIRRVIWLKDSAVKRGTKLVKLEKAGTLWDGLRLNNLTKEGGVQFPNGKKPEALLKKVIELSTDPGDIVLDSFAGSGTTGAVAHKMGRRWVMIELGEHCHSHIIPRMQRVIDGCDGGGITEAVAWQGGGGFQYLRLAPSLLEKDRWGNWVIARSYNAAMLAEAMCKHMGFTYGPSQDPAEYWRHGHSSERDFIFVTTANVTHDQLRAISEDVGPERTLLVCCKAFNARPDAFDNLTVKKIPQAVLSRCEWGRDDYSLRIAEAPPPPDDTPPPSARGTVPPRRARRAAAASTEPSLFSAIDAKGADK